jgi:hypothetical protein
MLTALRSAFYPENTNAKIAEVFLNFFYQSGKISRTAEEFIIE